jgi:hypothetical protein
LNWIDARDPVTLDDKASRRLDASRLYVQPSGCADRDGLSRRHENEEDEREK